MNERPILFSAPMVRAILEGRKTQTRRVVKPQPANLIQFLDSNNKPTGKFGWCSTHERSIDKHVRCPYGAVGDRLWVRETLGAECYASKRWDSVWYDVDSEDVENVPADWAPPRRSIRQHQETGGNIPEGGFPYWTAKVPSIFMPRWASRITLEVTGVRVEKLKNISDKDAIAEGLYTDSEGLYDWDEERLSESGWVSPAGAYWNLWEHINGKGSVDANPWVWVIEFKRVTA